MQQLIFFNWHYPHRYMPIAYSNADVCPSVRLYVCLSETANLLGCIRSKQKPPDAFSKGHPRTARKWNGKSDCHNEAY
jgi:hypothetical protein